MPWGDLIEKSGEISADLVFDFLTFKGLGAGFAGIAGRIKKIKTAFKAEQVAAAAGKVSAPTNELVKQTAALTKVAVEEGPEVAKKISKFLKKNPNIITEEGGNVVKSVQRAVVDVKKIKISELAKKYNQPHWIDLIHDPAHRGIVDSKSIQEALIGIIAEKKGFLRGPIKRDPTGAAEFIDKFGTAWDVKAAVSKTPQGVKIFKPDNFIKSISKSLRDNENVILDLTRIEPNDLISFIKIAPSKLSKQDMKKVLVVMDDNLKKMTMSRLEEVLKK